MADRIKKLLPQARIVVCHGQMHSDDIDQVFHAFKSGQADILDRNDNHRKWHRYSRMQTQS